MTSRGARLWRTALLGLALAGACDDVAGPEPEEGAFVGRWERRLWVGDAHATLVRGLMEGDVLYVGGVTPRGAGPFSVEESISARVIFRGPGVYFLAADDVSFMEVTGGDVITAWYQGEGSPAGVLRISRYDASTGAIEGEVRFTSRTDSPYASYGPTARLEDGRFRTVVVVQPVNTRAQ